MWKLTIKRNHTRVYKHDGSSLELEECFEYKAKHIDSLMDIMKLTNAYATDGVYTYEIEYEEGDTE